MLGVELEPVMSNPADWGGSTFPPQYPNIEITWFPVEEATVAAEDWQGYRIVRTGGDEEREWVFMDRNATGFTDTSPANGITYTYTVTYRKEINNGFDMIESEAVVLTGAATILYPTLTSESPDDPAVTMHFWRDLELRPATDHTEVESWGTLPFLFQGPKYQKIITGTFRAMDDDTGEARFTAADIVARVEALQRPHVTLNGKTVPRTLNYRDHKTEAPGVSVREFRDIYEHGKRTGTYSITLSQHA
jgi:hypothetical protein